MRWLLFTILLACKGDPKPAPTSNSGSGSAETPKAAVRERPALETDKPSRASHDDFEAEIRDPEWAPQIETGIKERFAQVRGAKLEQTECRKTKCRLTITGSQGDLAQTIADLEGPRGLHGYAKNVLLTAPAQKPDGTVELRAIAIFDR
jgi:hypothetical protein